MSNGNGALKSATTVKVFKEIAFMWLIPIHLIRRNGANIQPVHIRRGNKSLRQFRIVRDGGNYQTWSQHFRKLLLADFHHTGKREKKFPICETVVGVFTK